MREGGGLSRLAERGRSSGSGPHPRRGSPASAGPEHPLFGDPRGVIVVTFLLVIATATLFLLVADPSTDLFAKIPHGSGQTILREALLVADHNAYHLGALVVMSRVLKSR